MSDRNRTEWEIIIVGGGAAGVAAAEEIQRLEPRASVLILSEEDRLPYKRTKISKNIARGFDREEFAQLPGKWYAEAGFELIVGARVTALDPAGRCLELADGRRFGWGSLILATGADPVQPPETSLPDAAGLFVVRTAAQVESLRVALAAARRAAILGSGVLAVEVAEQVCLSGQEVVLVGRQERLMHRHLNEPAAERLRTLLGGQGVEVRLGQRLGSVERQSGGGFRLGLTAGVLEADLLVLCAGVRPRVELAARAGLAVDQGILVDSRLRTSHPAVFAAGDVAQHPDGTVTHLWHAAQHQGVLAAHGALGREAHHDNPPFRLKCEVFGQYFFSMNVPAELLSGDAPLRASEPLPAVGPAAPAGRQRRRPEGRDFGERGSPVARPPVAGSPVGRPPAPEPEEQSRGALYRCLYYRQQRLSGVVMVNDKERAKRYEAAVREEWHRDRVEAELPLS